MQELSEFELRHKKIYLLLNSNIHGSLRQQLSAIGLSPENSWCPAIYTSQDSYRAQHLTDNLVGVDRFDIAVVGHPRYLPYSLHYHDFYEFIAVISGSYYTVVGGKDYTVSKGQFFLIPPGTQHIIGVYDDDSIVINIVFSQAFFREEVLPELTSYSQSKGGADPYNVKYVIFDTHFSAAEKEEADTLSGMLSIGEHASLCYLFKSLIHLIMHSAGTEIIAVRQLSSRTVPNSLEITNFIQSNIRTVTIEDLAENFGYSPDYMEKLIVRKTGVPFKKLLRILRTELALFYCMSEQDHITYSELADHCGWSSVSCMKRALKAMNVNVRDKRTIKKDVLKT